MRWPEPAFETFEVTERSARGRRDDAAAGRRVVIPLYWQDAPDGAATGVSPDDTWPDRARPGSGERAVRAELRTLTVVCATGGGLEEARGWLPSLGAFEDFWRGVESAAGGCAPSSRPAVPPADPWTIVLAPVVWPPTARVRLILRPGDWQILAECLRQRYAGGSDARAALSDTEVVARHLARIDGEQDWGYLYLEVRRGHPGGRLVQTVSMEWRAAWGAAAYRIGQADRNLVSDLEQHRFAAGGMAFRVRELPEWDRVAALKALRLPAAGSFRWVMSPLSRVTAVFDEVAPTREPDGPQDARTGPGRPPFGRSRLA